MLPLFCKIFNSVPPSVITEKFVEAVQFTQVTSSSVIKDFFVQRCWSKPKQPTYILLHQNLPGLSTLSFSGLCQALGDRGEAARVQPEHRGGGQRHRLFLGGDHHLFYRFSRWLLSFYLSWRWPSSFFIRIGGDHHLFIRFEGNYYLLIYFIFLIVIFQTITYIHRALPSPSSWRRQLITIAFFYSFCRKD